MSLISEFEKTVNLFPEKVALFSEVEGNLTYRELNFYSNTIAFKLLTQSDMMGEENIVGLLFNTSFDLIASVLEVLKAGYAYLPLDPSYPTDRLNLMLETSHVKVVLSNPQTKDLLKEKAATIILDERRIDTADDIDCSKDKDVACVLFTSGSTGKPNAVMMTHEAIWNTVQWAITFYGLSSEDVDLQVPSCSFTSSVQDIFSTLLSGGCLVLLNERKMLNSRYLNMIADKYRVTHFDMVPSLYNEYLRVAEGTSTLRFVLLAGEPLAFNLVKKHFEKLPSVRLVNEYGMAETCSCCFAKEIMGSEERISIGRPIANMDYEIVEKDKEGIGELYIRGKGLALGYLI